MSENVSREGFFAELDGQRAAAKVRDDEQAGAERRIVTELETLMATEIRPLVESYVESLNKRKLRPVAHFSVSGFSIELRYQSGGKRSLSLGLAWNTGGARVEESFPNDDGRQYRSTTDVPGLQLRRGIETGSKWHLSWLEERLRRFIQDYLFYAPRHGGVSGG